MQFKEDASCLSLYDTPAARSASSPRDLVFCTLAFAAAWAEAMEGHISTSPAARLAPAQFQDIGLRALQAVRFMPEYAGVTQDMVSFATDLLSTHWRYGDQLWAIRLGVMMVKKALRRSLWYLKTGSRWVLLMTMMNSCIMQTLCIMINGNNLKISTPVLIIKLFYL